MKTGERVGDGPICVFGKDDLRYGYVNYQVVVNGGAKQPPDLNRDTQPQANSLLKHDSKESFMSEAIASKEERLAAYNANVAAAEKDPRLSP